jgi:hypothetical protein
MITYDNDISLGAVKDGFTESLKESVATLQEQGFVPFGDGYKDVLAEASVFATYKDSLSQDFSADAAEQFDILAENVRIEQLKENSIESISTISALTLPVMKKLWAKLSIKESIPTLPVSKPRFRMNIIKPYMIDAEGNKGYLPEALKVGNNMKFVKELSTEKIDAPADKYDLLADVNESAVEGARIDKIFSITSVTLKDDDSDANTKTFDVSLKIDALDTFTFQVEGDVTDEHHIVDTIFGTLDRLNGTITLTSLGGHVVDFTVKGSVTQERNTNTTEVGFENEETEHTIGSGVHINASVPVEWLKDNMALLQIDGIAKVIDIASNVLAQKLEIEGFEFLKDSYDDVAIYETEFDTIPSDRYTGSPKEWLSEIQRTIDFLANKMKMDNNFNGGKFVIIGNTLDISILPNVNWTFTSTEAEVAGVEVDYNIGAVSSANRYQIVSSPQIPQGAYYIFFVSKDPDQRTFTYSPYSFNIFKDGSYRNENNSLAPNIMMNKRHLFWKVTPLIGKIIIKNNDGIAR